MAHRGRDHDRKEPLWRKVNSLAHGVRHDRGGDFADARNGKAEARNGKAEARAEAEGITRASLGAAKRRGLDYTPLWRFLHSKVGQDWATVHAEAVARLDREEPIYWLVAPSLAAGKRVVLLGESSWWAGLCVDAQNRLAQVDPALTLEEMEPSCGCCTHTLNGRPFTRKWQG